MTWDYGNAPPSSAEVSVCFVSVCPKKEFLKFLFKNKSDFFPFAHWLNKFLPFTLQIGRIDSGDKPAQNGMFVYKDAEGWVCL